MAPAPVRSESIRNSAPRRGGSRGDGLTLGGGGGQGRGAQHQVGTKWKGTYHFGGDQGRRPSAPGRADAVSEGASTWVGWILG